MERPQAVILGAGVAGLAAALALGESGRLAPLLLEREAVAGGLARSLHFKGVSTDLGPHRIYTELDEVRRLIDRVAAPSLFTVQRTSHIYLRGHFLPYPPRPLAMLARVGPWRMARFMASFAGERLRPAPAADDETYESLMRRAFGRELYDWLLRPYSAKTWKIDPAELHADTARVRVSAGSLAKMVGGLLRRHEARGRQTSLSEFQYVRGGAETLVRHLREAAEALGARVRTGCEVTALRLDERGWARDALARTQGDGNGGNDASADADAGAIEALPGEAFLSTVPLPVLLGRLLPEAPALAEAREAAAGLQFIDMIFVCLIIRRKVIRGDNWLYFPEPHLVFNRAYEAKNFDPAMGPEDKSVLCVEITHRAGDPLAARPDAEIQAQVVEQLAATGLFAAGEVEDGIVYRVPYAYPLYTLDYRQRIERALAGLAAIPNLLTLGRQGLFNHNNMDHSISMGLHAARTLAEGPRETAAARWYAQAGEYRLMRIVD